MNDANRRPLSDYEANLALIVVNGFVTARSAGLMASLISYYEREMERERLAAIERQSKHVGTVGERGVFEGLTLVSVRSWESQFGMTHLHKFVSAEGNIFTWFCTGDSPFEDGQKYNVKATVKKHDAYNGVNQTVLNRCAVDVPKAPKKPRAKKVALPDPVVEHASHTDPKQHAGSCGFCASAAQDAEHREHLATTPDAWENTHGLLSF